MKVTVSRSTGQDRRMPFRIREDSSAPSPRAQRIAFDNFQIDLRSGEIRKNGARLRLQAQPFQLLVLLVENAGDMVSREEICRELWPADTFVDFEHSLTAAVNKIREALCDSADNPRYIETLPKRGYRFIGKIKPEEPVEIPVGQSQQHQGTSQVRAALEAIGPGAATAATPETTGSSRNFRRWAIVASVVCLLAAGTFVWVKLPSSPTMPRVVNSVRITKDGLRKAQATRVLVSDGTRLYFQEGSIELNTALMQVSTQGGETAGIPVSLQNPIAFDFSQSHSALLLGAGEYTLTYEERPLWVLPLPGGAPHRLGDILARDACWSPDGRRLVFSNGKDIFGAKADGSEVRKLAPPDLGFLSRIQFSPDGRRLRFGVVNGDDTGVMEMAADGSGLHRLPIDGGCCGRWSSDGKYYFYLKGRDVWVLSEPRSLFGKIKFDPPAQLTAGPIAYSALAPGANGKELFVVGDQPRVELVRYARDSKQFVPFLGGISAGELEVSPDGQWVTYTTFPESDLWRSKLDGTERLQLTFPPTNAHEPRWSPDGEKILFTDFPSKIFVIPAGGGTPRQLMPSDHAEFAGAGAWLPDGNSIFFGRHMGCSVFDNSCWGIYRLDLKTQEVSKVPGSEGMVAARLSHDGHYLTAHLIGQNKVMLYDLKTKRWSELAKASGSIAWSHNSQFVYLRLSHGADASDAELVRIRVPDGQVQHILDLRDVTLGGTWPNWVSLLPDDSPLLTLDKSTDEIYRLDLEYR
jgi:DNA-binding winged helix-turn-helix (wHTH) protein/Tol biopolymer transport system component